jgi:hypothetical protein
VDQRKYSQKTTAHKRGAKMPNTNPIDGSPGNEPCANTNSCRTANKSSPRKGISPAAVQTVHTPEPVPLYLIPQVLSKEIHRFGGAISEMHIRRSGSHNYRITITSAVGQGEKNGA